MSQGLYRGGRCGTRARGIDRTGAQCVYVTPLVSPVMVQVAVWLPVGNAGEGVQLPAGTLPGPVAVTR